MKRTIRWKFTAVFVGFMAFAIILMWGINNWCLEDYYLRYKTDVLEEAYRSIDAIVREEGVEERDSRDPYPVPDEFDLESEELTEVIRNLRDTSNITLLIYDSLRGKTLVSSAHDIDMLRDRVSYYILSDGPSSREILRQYDNYTIQKTYEPATKTYYLESWGFFSDNGTSFIMLTPLDSIRESAFISNHFLMYVGILVIFLGSVCLYFIIQRITSPIYRLSQLSEKMSRLDFDAKYESRPHSAVEIDRLGNSMNVLSDQLKETIGELKEANAQLQRDIEAKTQVDEMRKEFIANVSHELKTPIALIQGYAEGLVEGMAEDPENRDYYCGVIMDEANKMNKMVKQLLTLTTLEFGREQANRTRFELSELIRGVAASAGLPARQKGIALEIAGDAPVYVLADEFQMEEVVTNYLNNAVNHADGEKKIEIRTEVIPERQKVRVTVFNTGEPIPEPDLEHLWTKFYKVDKARTREYGGSGIGLSIVKAIMEGHHEAYGVENRENGVAFWFELSLAESGQI